MNIHGNPLDYQPVSECEVRLRLTLDVGSIDEGGREIGQSWQYRVEVLAADNDELGEIVQTILEAELPYDTVWH